MGQETVYTCDGCGKELPDGSLVSADQLVYLTSDGRAITELYCKGVTTPGENSEEPVYAAGCADALQAAKPAPEVT